MKRVDRYLLAESLPPLLFGLLLYSTLAVVSMTIPRLQWVVGVPVQDLGTWLALQFPAALVQTLPIAMVLAVLLAFGRLSSGNELLAMQAGAVSLSRVSRVFIVLGLLAALASLSLNQWVLPETNARVGTLYWRLTSGTSGLFRLAQQNIPVDDLMLHFERADRRTDELFDVRIERWDDRNLTVVFADRAEFDPRGLRLYGYRTLALDLGALGVADSGAALTGAPGAVKDEAQGGASAATGTSPDSAEAVLERLIRADSRGADRESSLLLTMSSDQDELVTRFSQGGFEDPRSISGAYLASQDEALPEGERRSALVLFQRKLAEPFASLVLLLVAVPLSIGYARSRSVAFGLSLVVTLVWYLLLTFGQLIAQTGGVPVWLGVWMPNLVLGAVGLSMMVKRVGPN